MMKSMLRTLLLAAAILLAGNAAFSQDSLILLNHSRNEIKQTGMAVLGSWAVANIATGTVGYYNSGGAAQRFHQMNIIWNMINLGAATAGYFGSKADNGRQLTPEESLKAQQKIEKVFVINAGLDVAYIGTGLYLRNRGHVKNSDRLRGYGASVLLQGAFLLLFDGTMYGAERYHGNKLRRFLTHNQLIFNGRQLGMQLQL
ncbi:DUF6992 family protein [Mucilaginibacter sp.]